MSFAATKHGNLGQSLERWQACNPELSTAFLNKLKTTNYCCHYWTNGSSCYCDFSHQLQSSPAATNHLIDSLDVTHTLCDRCQHNTFGTMTSCPSDFDCRLGWTCDHGFGPLACQLSVIGAGSAWISWRCCMLLLPSQWASRCQKGEISDDGSSRCWPTRGCSRCRHYWTSSWTFLDAQHY